MQLTPVERWALQFMETVDTEWAEEQLAAAEAEIEQQKKEWEMERLAIEQADERSKRLDEEIDDDDLPLTYALEDAKNQVNDISDNKISFKNKKKLKRLAPKGENSISKLRDGASKKKKKIAGNAKFRSRLRRCKSGDDEGDSRSSSVSEFDNPEVKSRLKVEAIRLEHLHLLSDDLPDSNLIAKSLAKIKRSAT